ncbi:MAG: hypothetical protein WCH44_13210, partial [Betaproteobacteria bacterium]
MPGLELDPDLLQQRRNHSFAHTGCAALRYPSFYPHPFRQRASVPSYESGHRVAKKFADQHGFQLSVSVSVGGVGAAVGSFRWDSGMSG